MTLDDFVGKEFDLTGVDTAQIANTNDYGGGDASTITFELDGVCYQAIEDPEDGYRSCMKEIVVVPYVPQINRFHPVRVRGQKTPEVGSTTHDAVQFVCLENDKVVLEVGTHNTDDYYPSFVGDFRVKDMPDNSPEKLAEREARQRELEEQARALDAERTATLHGWGTF
jgi:hypothetical protein